MDSRFDIVDALVDGERVDAGELKRALADEAARDYLVDAWLLREVVQDDLAVEAVPSWRARRSDARLWLVAAAIAILCLGSGYIVGYRMAGRLASAPSEMAGRPATVESAPVAAPRSFPVPPPTRVIQVEFGSDAMRGGGL